jgi:orotate phosphoribosyltransferase
MLDYQQQFIEYALTCEVLKFGQFQLKSGRISPYFFNTGLFNTGAKLDKLGHFYAQALTTAAIKMDMLYGPAYKGIPLVSTTAMAYARLTSNDIAFAFNRKEIKTHGEGGRLIGSPLRGKVVMVDDVITAGTSVRESVDVITQANAVLAGVVIALDRQEKGQNTLSATQEVTKQFNIPVVAIICLANIVEFLEIHDKNTQQLTLIKTYQQHYGI